MSKYAGKLITLGTTGGYSMQFPGVATAYLETPWNAALTFGTTNWTIEAWVYPTTTLTQVAIISNWTATAGQFQLRRTATNRVEFVYNLNGVTTTITGTQYFILPNQWTHVCVMRSTTGIYVLINGVQDVTGAVSSTTISGTGQVIRVGVEGAAVNPFAGFISNARIVVGTAIYSVSNFRVPMILDPTVSGTQYLACAAPTFKDLSTNNFTVAGAGTYPVIPQVSAFTPYGGESPLTSNPALGTGPAGVYRSSDTATYSVNRATAAYDPYFSFVRTLIHGSGWFGTSNRAFSALQNYSYTPSTSTASTISGGFTLTIGGTVTGTYTVGMPITGTGVREGTIITAYNTGTGGAGTYYVSGATQAVSSTPINGVDSGYITTVTGNVSQGSFTPFGSAGWGFLNDNTSSSFIQTGATTNMSFGTGDYTMEFWVMFPVVTASKYILDFRTANTLPTSPSIILNASSQIELNGIFNAGVVPVRYRWYHVALCRSGGTARFYVDGVQTASIANATAYTAGSNTLRVAKSNDAANVFTNLAMSNLRIIKGQALYTAGFTPSKFRLTNHTVGSTGPGAATKITGTVALLTLQDNRFVDNSGNNVSVTPSGNTTSVAARIINYAPLYSTRPYSPGSGGGSMYFPGGSAYVTMAGANTNCAFGTGDFTVECWIYPTSIAAVQLFFDTNATTTTGRFTLQYETNQSVSVTVDAGVNFLLSTAGVAPLFAWTHVYVGRVSGQTYLYINGVVQSSTNTAKTFICDANRPVIGTNGGTLGSNSFIGYVSGLRITRVSLGTTTVPTEPPQMVQYTALLMNGADSALDDSSGSINYRTAGSTSISTSLLPPNKLTSNIVFNGTTDYLDAANPALLTVIGNWTVEAWVYPNSIPASQQTMFYVNGGNNSYAMCRLDLAATTGFVQLLVSNDGISWLINSTATFGPNYAAWNHLAVVRSGASVYVFLNGRLAITNALNALTALMTPTITRFGALLTGNGATDSQFFAGRMADIRVTQAARYNTAGFVLPTSQFQDM